MTPHKHRKWSVAGLCRDDQAIADVRAQAASGGGGHASRRLADGETVVVRTFRSADGGRKGPHDIRAVKRTIDERRRIDGTNTGLDNREEIGAKVGGRKRQCECFGSDQFESPVTTSNFLRSALTSS